MEEPTPAPLPSPTPTVLAACGEQGPHIDSDPVVAFHPERDGFIWVLPDGTDANVTTDDIRAADPAASDSTAISFPLWSQPAVSPDHSRSAVTFNRRYSGSSETQTLILVSGPDDPVLNAFELPGSNLQALVTLQWLPQSGCLTALVFEPTSEQRLILMSNSGEVVAMFNPKLGRGTVLDSTATGWIVVERLTWEPPEIELFNVRNSGTTIVVGADEPLPDFPGLPGEGQTARQFVEDLKTRQR